MTRPRFRLPRWLSAVAFLSALIVALPAAGQTPSPFRITHSADKGTQAQVTVTGRVFNEARADAIDVYVTAEALDGGGKIMASGVTYVGTVPAGGSNVFIIKVPSARTAANFRVLVTSFRFGYANQS
jgi:hypothetical protein